MNALPDQKQFRRLFAIQMIWRCLSPSDLAATLGVDRQTLRAWIKRFNSGGIDALLDRPRTGRSREISADADGNESPRRHRVTISKSFYIGVYEVTQAQYERVTGNNPSGFKSADRPVENVSWDDAREFCGKLSQREGVTYRMPTEAEWEYACRAGTTTRYYWGDSSAESVMKRYSWYRKNAADGYWTEPHAAEEGTQEVGRKQPNAWGLYDMSGNVWEWCQDYYDADYYSTSPSRDPVGPSSGDDRVLRGGG